VAQLWQRDRATLALLYFSIRKIVKIVYELSIGDFEGNVSASSLSR